MEFEQNLPHDCPPSSAVSVSGVLFRMARKLPLTPKEFQSYLTRKGAGSFEPHKRCEAAGLSVYRNDLDAFAAIEKAAEVTPLARKSVIVRAELSSDWGVIAPTPKDGDSHHTWWVARGKSPHEIFELAVQP